MSRDVLIFLLQAVAISLSGVMAPGPVAAATLAAGSHRRHAGAWVAIGHGVVELPLMLLIVAVVGMARVLQTQAFKVGVGIAGGAALVLMAALMLRPAAAGKAPGAAGANRPLWTGIALTAGNPYFLVWWATVGLALATRAISLGLLAFAMFALVHWLCDLVWLELLSLASHRGVRLLGPRAQRIVPVFCAAAMGFFGGLFLYDAIKTLLG